MHAPIPARITIDFRDAAAPANGWIVGRATDDTSRLDVLTTVVAEPREAAPAPPAYDGEPCTCPDWDCCSDHGND